MTFIHTGRSKVVLMLDMLVEAGDDIGDREQCRFLEAPPEAHHLQQVGVLMKEATKVLSTQQ